MPLGLVTYRKTCRATLPQSQAAHSLQDAGIEAWGASGRPYPPAMGCLASHAHDKHEYDRICAPRYYILYIYILSSVHAHAERFHMVSWFMFIVLLSSGTCNVDIVSMLFLFNTPANLTQAPCVSARCGYRVKYWYWQWERMAATLYVKDSGNCNTF